MGTAISVNAAMKCFTHCMILAFGTWISAYTLGQSADELIGFFDKYSDDTSKEGSDKEDPSDVDPDGTSIGYDLLYHSITAGYAYVVLSTIMLGGYWFVNTFSPYTIYLPNCDLDSVSASTYANAKDTVPKLRDMTYAECQTAVTSMFNTIDLDNNGVVSQCEDAKFLLGIGNSKEYATSYPGTYSLANVKAMCEWIVPDGFDQKPVQSFNFLEDLAKMWPFSEFIDESMIPGSSS